MSISPTTFKKKKYNYMKEGRDFSIVNRINCHFNDMNEDLMEINSFDDFVNNKEKRRAILFDFLQIGELTNQLSKNFLNAFDNKDALRLIAIRNRIVHGYSTIRDDIIYTTLKNHLPQFINELNVFARKHYLNTLKGFLGKHIKVMIDRPLGYKRNEIIYTLNYGYTEEITALDGEFQDVYILDEDKPIKEISGTVIAIIHRENDIEDKLVVMNKIADISEKEIENAIEFQEQYFKHTIIKKA